MQFETVHDGIMLALVGLITRNETYLRQAVSMACIEHWAEGFVDRKPGYDWYHSAFAPNVASITTSLLLDWTGLDWTGLDLALPDARRPSVCPAGHRRERRALCRTTEECDGQSGHAI